MAPFTLIPSGRFLLNQRFEKVIEVTSRDHPERVKRSLIRAAAGDPPGPTERFYATGRYIRDASTLRIVASVCEAAGCPETLAALLSKWVAPREAEAA